MQAEGPLGSVAQSPVLVLSLGLAGRVQLRYRVVRSVHRAQ